MRQVRTYYCQPCATTVELLDQRDDDRFAAWGLQHWQCPGCRMHVHGRPHGSTGGVSGMPMWLQWQFWTDAGPPGDRALVDHLFAVVRPALAEAAAVEVARDAVVDQARAVLARVARGLRAPVVPPTPALTELLDAVEARGDAGVDVLWRPFVEQTSTGVDVTFRVRPPMRGGMFAFEFRAPRGGGGLRLTTCYNVSRALPDGVEPWPTR